MLIKIIDHKTRVLINIIDPLTIFLSHKMLIHTRAYTSVLTCVLFAIHFLSINSTPSNPSSNPSSTPFPLSIATHLAHLSRESWYDPTATATTVDVWKNALIACPHCHLPLIHNATAHYRSLLTFRALPDRKYLYRVLIPAIVHHQTHHHTHHQTHHHTHHHTHHQDRPHLNILSIGQQWYTIEEEILILHHFNITTNYITMDINPSIEHMFSANHCTQDALALPHTCQGIKEDYFDIVLINGVVGWGINTVDTAQQLMTAVSASAKHHAIVVVGRNVPRLCCGLDIYGTSHLSPYSIVTEDEVLPWRKSFAQDIGVGGGHVYDLLRNAKHVEILEETLQDLANPGQHRSMEAARLALTVQFYVDINAVATLTTLTVPLARRIATNHPSTTNTTSNMAPTTPIIPTTNSTNVTPLTLRQERHDNMVKVASTYCATLGINEPSCTASIYTVLDTQLATYTAVVESHQNCVKHSLLVVAHPDDEALFAGQELIRDPACWVVVCATNR